MKTLRVLTGITTSGTPHLGNYVGAVRPTVRASRLPQVDSFYFLADYHALIKCDEPARIQRTHDLGHTRQHCRDVLAATAHRGEHGIVRPIRIAQLAATLPTARRAYSSARR